MTYDKLGISLPYAARSGQRPDRRGKNSFLELRQVDTLVAQIIHTVHLIYVEANISNDE